MKKLEEIAWDIAYVSAGLFFCYGLGATPVIVLWSAVAAFPLAIALSHELP